MTGSPPGTHVLPWLLPIQAFGILMFELVSVAPVFGGMTAAQVGLRAVAPHGPHGQPRLPCAPAPCMLTRSP